MLQPGGRAGDLPPSSLPSPTTAPRPSRRQSSVFMATCLASGARVVLKRYVKAKLYQKAEHKMRREVSAALQ